MSHLDHEEADTERAYLDNEDHPAMKDMAKTFARVSPARGGRLLAWLLDGASCDERAAVHESVPHPVLTVSTGVFGRGYREARRYGWRR